MANNYSDDSIVVLEGLDAVRKRPGMYIGSTDTRGLHHLVWEIVDNSIDEVLAGYGKEIIITICNDNSIMVQDFGRGMPCGMHKSGKPTTEVILTVLHAGGKFGGENSGYKTSGGLHGVGSSVVNALSQFLEVRVQRDGNIYCQRFENGGHPVTTLEVVGKAENKKTGTTIHFKPDPKIFSTTLYNYDTIKERVRESAFLIKGLKIVLIDERTKKKEEFLYENGIKEYVDFLNKDKEHVHETEYFEGKYNRIEVECAFQYTKTYSENIYSFVNNVRTKDGGTHEVGLKAGMTKVINEYAKKYALIKDKDPKLEGADIREGLTCVLSLRIPEDLLEFEGQTKDKLGSPEARPAVENFIADKLFFYLEENKEFSNNLIKKTVDAYRAREAARKARDEARLGKTKNKKEVLLSGKLSPANGKNKDINELFLVEGDSAGGSAKKGRDRHFQAILPLRGKVLNTERAKIDEILKNEEINTIIHTIGADFGLDFDITKAQYNKVIIMTDADTDGAHIQILLLTFFFRYMRALIEAGRVYIACPPLYKISKKKGSKEEFNYAWSDEELQALIKKYGSGYSIQRYKGLGEMNDDQLWETTMNPETRTLIKVSIDDIGDAEKRIKTLMGDEVEPRRDWIENHVSFTVEDDFQIGGEQ